MDNDNAVEFITMQAKKHVRASSILGEPFRPHAYIPLDISLEKIKETLKELGYDGELPELPDNAEGFRALASMPLDFASKRKDSLNILGRLLAMADISNVIVVCDTTAPTETGGEADVLCVASVDLKAPDNMVLLPYRKEKNDDVSFGDEVSSGAADDSLRDSIIEGFLETEAKKYLQKHPDEDTDAYVDGLPSLFPNMDGALNRKD